MSSGLIRAAGRLGKQLAALIYPHKCFLCGGALAGAGWLCGECELPRTGGELCAVCGKADADCLCARTAPVYRGAAVPLYYIEGVRHGIHRFKYNNRRYYAPFLAELMAERVRERFGTASVDLITFVPLSPRKRGSRGFCQTRLLAEELSKRIGIPVRGGLLRHTGNRAAQASQKGFAAREANAGRSFQACEGVKLEGELVLLVDDVLTTGATMRRCARLLTELGASGVVAAAAATTRSRA